MQPELIIFDCDGVLIDSEILAFQALTEILDEIYNIKLTAAEAIQRYMGVSTATEQADMEQRYGIKINTSFAVAVKQKQFHLFEKNLQPINGIFDLLDVFISKKCVASSSSPERLSHTLKLVGLWERFAPNIFSFTQVKHGKPAPDLFLFAAAQMGVEPASCIVIEDSVNGIRAAKAAGMPVFGFTGGSHCGEGHGELLLKEGAEEVFCNMADLSKVLLPLMNQQAAHV